MIVDRKSFQGSDSWPTPYIKPQDRHSSPFPPFCIVAIGVVLALAFYLLPQAIASDAKRAEQVCITGPSAIVDRLIGPRIASLKRATGLDVLLRSTHNPSTDDLQNGRCDAMVAYGGLVRSLGNSFSIYDGDGLSSWQSHIITFDLANIIVHPSNPLPALSREELKGLADGTIGNWKALKWKDLPVTLVTANPRTVFEQVFQEKLMGGDNFTESGVNVENASLQVGLVSRTPGAIAIISNQLAAQQETKRRVKLAKTPELLIPVAMIARSDAPQKVRLLFQFFEGEAEHCCYDEDE